MMSAKRRYQKNAFNNIFSETPLVPDRSIGTWFVTVDKEFIVFKVFFKDNTRKPS